MLKFQPKRSGDILVRRRLFVQEAQQLRVDFLRMLDYSYSLLLDLVGCYPVSFRTFSSQSDFLVRSCASDMCAAERILVRQPFGALRAAERGLVTSVVPDQKDWAQRRTPFKSEHPPVPYRARLFLPDESVAKYPTFS